MDKNLEFLIDFLTEFRYSSIHASENGLSELMAKYDNMLFLGSKFNSIYSNQLLHYIKSNNDFNISEDEFLELIPKACRILNMKYEAMIEVSDLNDTNNKISCYNIILW
ncbi:hypothetical protein QJR26_08830 [Clostridium baratii]